MIMNMLLNHWLCCPWNIKSKTITTVLSISMWVKWEMNWPSVLLTMMMLLNLQYCSCSFKNEKSFNGIVKNNHTPKFNSVRDEFTSSADDNEHAPDEPILFIRNGKWTNENKWNHSNLNTFSDPVKWELNCPPVLMTM